MLNKSSKSLVQFASIFLFVVLATSIISAYIQSSKALGQEDEETAYLKFASQAVKQSGNSNANTTAATTQLPEAAKGPPIPTKGYLVQEIRDHLYWVTDGSYNTMFLVTNKGVVAVDAPPSIGNNYLKAIAKVTDKPVTYVIYSHAHTDHIGAASHIALNNYDFDTYVGGHLTRLGTRNDVIVQKEFVSDLEKAAGKANQEVLFSKIASQVGHFDNPWLIFSKYIDAVNENCVNTMMPKWENRLGGAQQFMSTHCFTMAESGRVDPTVQALLQNSTFVYK